MKVYLRFRIYIHFLNADRSGESVNKKSGIQSESRSSQLMFGWLMPNSSIIVYDLEA